MTQSENENKATIEERAYKAVLDMLRINENYISSFISGYYRGATEQKQIDIDERKRLEQTPITEEWLKEHGWEKVLKLSVRVKMVVGNDYLEYDIRRKELFVFRNRREGNYLLADSIIDNVDNVAKLYDACELCGIELDK